MQCNYTTEPAIRKPLNAQRVTQHHYLTSEEMDAIYAQGDYYYHLQYIPSGQRDRAIYCVGFYLFRNGFGYNYEEERLELLTEWFFDRRQPSTKSRITEAENDLHRAVYWESTRPRGLADLTIDRLVQTKVYTLNMYRKANLKRENIARQKLVIATQELQAEGTTITLRALMRTTGCSHHTIAKHSDIWKAPLTPMTVQEAKALTPSTTAQSTPRPPIPVITPATLGRRATMTTLKLRVQEGEVDKEKAVFGADLVTATTKTALEVVPVADFSCRHG